MAKKKKYCPHCGGELQEEMYEKGLYRCQHCFLLYRKTTLQVMMNKCMMQRGENLWEENAF